MENSPLVLASASPRRRRLIGWLGVPFRSVATDTPEDLSSPLRHVPPILARFLAGEKAKAAAASGERGVIVACDTIVVLDGEVLGKPIDREDARRMLRALSGRTHQVYTGVAILQTGESEPVTFAESTDVAMNELSGAAIEQWLESDEALGCAGAYNIERHLGSVATDQCYQNVAGLPLCHLYARLLKAGVAGMESPVAACDTACGRTCAIGPDVCGSGGIQAATRPRS